MEQVEATVTDPRDGRQGDIKNRVLQIVGEDSGKILVVEDEIELAEVLEFNLIRKGFDVLLAHDGLEACRLIGREQPDLILLDLMLPLLDGWEVCRMVRSHQDPAFRKTPIIMLSALGSTEDRIKGYDLGADLYLPKPYAIKEVIIKSRQLIQQHRDFLQLNQQVSSLQSWADMQDQWQQALFHELRNQLTVISGMALHLQQDRQLPPGRTEQFAEQISSSSHYLGALAENYLLVRRLEDKPGQLQGEPFLLANLLGELQELFQPLAEQKSCQLKLSCDSSVLLELHPIGLKIVLSSLIDNALKYSMLDGHILLSVQVDTECVRILLQDDGPGVDPGEREKIFTKFYRGRDNREKLVGSGLGLYMARALSEAMGGSLCLLDNDQPGCCFQLSLPRPC
ncbi:Histidine kinase-, DNA gyrase B-, and HSP90-like ATPase [Malonomonas rubra DSM 5091]|uniref:histidine kinase n=1 Tax=Malonomonas rubra DSM 5091 TaxID=1122189 RepID=A0A1M6H5V0_MALRU|nr:response regulator [Malonomonas rubra]SHJ17563.1 Histidine kinase-, DNA gyrase B-, and HSP90-like ATPase [Malonomonas rubra DSM 5091]